MGDIALKLRSREESLEAKIEEISQKIYEHMRGGDEKEEEKVETAAAMPVDIGVLWTFEDAVIARDYASGKIYEIKYEEEEDEGINFTDINEVDEVYVQKSLLGVNPEVSMKEIYEVLSKHQKPETCYKDLGKINKVNNPDALYSWIHYKAKGEFPAIKGRTSLEICGPIVTKNKEKRIASAAVLVPGEEDYDGETVTKEKIADAAYEWMESYRNVDLKHSLNNVGIPVESYLLPMDMEVTIAGKQKILPEGSWVLSSKFPKDETWNAIKSGELTGYSVMGIKRKALEMAQKSSSGDIALKKTLLQDLGEDWIAAAVSVTDDPAVPKSKFFALKSRKKKSFFGKIADAVTGGSSNKESVAQKEGKTFSKENFAKIKQIKEMVEELFKKAQEENSSLAMERPAKKTKNKEEVEMTKEELEKALKEFKSDLKEELEEDLVKSIKEKLAEENDDGNDAGGEEGDEGEEGTAEKEKGKDPEEKNEDVETLKAEVKALKGKEAEHEAFKGKVEKMLGKATKSNKVEGQDDEGDDDTAVKERRYEGRDSFGRKIIQKGSDQ